MKILKIIFLVWLASCSLLTVEAARVFVPEATRPISLVAKTNLIISGIALAGYLSLSQLEWFDLCVALDLCTPENPHQAVLLEASLKGDLAAVKGAISDGAIINVDEAAIAPLYAASLNCHLDVVQFLLEKGADVHARTVDGVTALHAAALVGCVKVVRLLLKNKAFINARDNLGKTPLHEAAMYNHLAVVRLLSDEGASPKIKNHRGKTPIDEAKMRRYHQVVQALRTEMDE